MSKKLRRRQNGPKMIGFRAILMDIRRVERPKAYSLRFSTKESD